MTHRRIDGPERLGARWRLWRPRRDWRPFRQLPPLRKWSPSAIDGWYTFLENNCTQLRQRKNVLYYIQSVSPTHVAAKRNRKWSDGRAHYLRWPSAGFFCLFQFPLQFSVPENHESIDRVCPLARHVVHGTTCKGLRHYPKYFEFKILMRSSSTYRSQIISSA